MKSISVTIATVLGGIFGLFLLSLLFAFPVKWLWNSTMPELFGFKVIGVWMAWKLSFLSSLLVKSTTTVRTS